MTDPGIGTDTGEAGRASPPPSVLEAALAVWRQTGAQHVICVEGGSMRPALRDGDRLMVSHGCVEVRLGDVVVFWRQDSLIAHRVVRICRGEAGPAFITKGDNATRFDPPLSAEEIIGRALSVERDGRCMSLQTIAWRNLGYLIAVGTRLWARLFGSSRTLKHRSLGRHPSRAAALLRRRLLALRARTLEIAQVVVCRWHEDGSNSSRERSSSLRDRGHSS